LHFDAAKVAVFFRKCNFLEKLQLAIYYFANCFDTDFTFILVFKA